MGFPPSKKFKTGAATSRWGRYPVFRFDQRSGQRLQWRPARAFDHHQGPVTGCASAFASGFHALLNRRTRLLFSSSVLAARSAIAVPGVNPGGAADECFEGIRSSPGAVCWHEFSVDVLVNARRRCYQTLGHAAHSSRDCTGVTAFWPDGRESKVSEWTNQGFEG